MPIELKDITTGEVAGSGFYDELMRASNAHLVKEYHAGRIVGADYGTVYLGMMTANLQTAASTVLQYELNNEQIKLIGEQIDKARRENELLELQKEQLRIANSTALYTLDNMMPLQVIQLEKGNELLTEQILTQKQQTELVTAQIAQSVAQTAVTGKQEDMVDEQILTEKTNTTTPTAGMTFAAYNKAIAEGELLVQRKATEDAQTQGDETTVGGTLGAQMALYTVQAEGFLRDAEQKVAKLHADAFSVSHSITPEVYTPDLYNLDGDNTMLVMAKLLEGIGVTPV